MLLNFVHMRFMAKKHPLLILLDGNSLLHRAWHAVPPLTTREGLVVNAVYGFCVVLEKLLEEWQPTHMAVAWDLKGATFRHDLFVPYKAQREEKSQDLYDQIPMIQEVLEAYGISSVSAPKLEADDVIGILAHAADASGMDVRIVTGDLDALQLVNDRIHVVFFQKGVSQTKEYDTAAVVERYGLKPSELVDYKAFRGDASDNIPGVKGIGEKSGTELIQSYGSVEGVFQALEKGLIPEKIAKHLRGAEETALLAKKLVKIVTDAKLSTTPKDTQRNTINTKELARLFQKYEFRSLLKKHNMSSTPPPPVGRVEPEAKKQKASREVLVVEAKTPQEIEHWFRRHQGASGSCIYIPQAADLFGQTASWMCVYVSDEALVVQQPSPELLAAIHAGIILLPKLVLEDAKACMHIFGKPLSSHVFDIMLAGYTLSPGERAYDIATLARVHQDALSKPARMLVSYDGTATPEVARHVLELSNVLEKAMEETEVKRVYETIELPLVPVLFDMEQTGICVDAEVLHRAKTRISKKVEDLVKRIYTLTETEFNINSPQQLADVLFSHLKLPTKGIKKTKQGFSTAASELDKLEGLHEVIPLIKDYREFTKLLSTYIETLPDLIAKDGRIHTSYNQTIAATGRLSSSNPNLQNIPLRTEEGMEIRRAFVASKGMRLISADYSQMEIRLMAVIANDKPFITAFQEKADIHTRTAAEIFGKTEEEVTSSERQAAKAINFGIMYGMGPRSLARSTGLSQEEAKNFIDRYFTIHAATHAYMERTKAEAHTLGYTKTLFGRRRYVPEITSGMPQLIAQAERVAINMPVQGTESDVVKLAMISIAHWLEKSAWPAKLLLQVHDEYIFEVSEEAVDAVAKGIKEIMEGIVSYDVPLVANVEVGLSWGDMETWNPKKS